MSSHSAATSCITWLENSTQRPDARSSRISSRSMRTALTSRPLVGSSRMIGVRPMHQRARQRHLQTLALRIALRASSGDRTEPEALDQLVRWLRSSSGAVQAVQLAVVANVLAAGEMRIQAARVRQHAERSAYLQRLRRAIVAVDDARGPCRRAVTVLRMRSVVDLPAPL